MPVAPQVGRLGRYDDDVAQSDGDVLTAARAQVHLDRLVGLDPPDLDLVPADHFL
jgi:hypothetical protein